MAVRSGRTAEDLDVSGGLPIRERPKIGKLRPRRYSLERMDASGGAFVIDHGPDARYRIGRQDNSRWDGFVFHPGDIVISTRSRSGTTWMQV